MSTITVRIEPSLDKSLGIVSKRLKRSKSDIIRDAIKREVALQQFENARSSMMLYAERAGYLLDEDVFKVVS